MSPRILLVDRDPDTRAILRAVFEDRGHDVVDVADGAEGLELADRGAPDVIVGDFPLDVPGHSPFVEHARRHGAGDALIVSFTSRATPEALARASAVCDAVITKPADPLEVVAEVERLLEAT